MIEYDDNDDDHVRTIFKLKSQKVFNIISNIYLSNEHDSTAWGCVFVSVICFRRF